MLARRLLLFYRTHEKEPNDMSFKKTLIATSLLTLTTGASAGDMASEFTGAAKDAWIDSKLEATYMINRGLSAKPGASETTAGQQQSGIRGQVRKGERVKGKGESKRSEGRVQGSGPPPSSPARTNKRVSRKG